MFTDSFGSVQDFITISSSVRDRIPRYRRLVDSYLRPRIFPVLVEVIRSRPPPATLLRFGKDLVLFLFS